MTTPLTKREQIEQLTQELAKEEQSAVSDAAEYFSEQNSAYREHMDFIASLRDRAVPGSNFDIILRSIQEVSGAMAQHLSSQALASASPGGFGVVEYPLAPTTPA